MAEQSFTISGAVDVDVTVSDTGGILTFSVAVNDAGASIGDLRGFFFNIDAATAGLTISGDDITSTGFDTLDLGDGVNLTGRAESPFDVGVAFGSASIAGTDDIRSTSFTVAADDALTLADISNEPIGVRLTSVGPDGGARDDAAKLVDDYVGFDAPIYRINAPGPSVAAIDDGPNWLNDRLTDRGFTLNPGDDGVTGFIVVRGSTVPDYVPDELFETERFDFIEEDPELEDGEMSYTFAIDDPGLYRVNLFVADGFEETTQVGDRIFDIALEGSVPAAFDDIDVVEMFGNATAGVISATVEVTDGALNVDFLHEEGDVDNPFLNAIEIARTPTAISTDVTGSPIRGTDGEETLSGDGRMDFVRGGAGNDLVSGGGGDDVVTGDAGDDEVFGGLGNDIVRGGAGDDVISGGAGDDRVTGDRGDDIMMGDSGDDIIRGGLGDDIVSGGSGRDTLWGNSGNDVFSFAVGDGVEIVKDFFTGVDQLDFSDHGLTADEILASATQVDKDVRIDLGGGDLVILRLNRLSDLDADDFILG